MLSIAHRARRAVLLVGTTGVGKSQVVAQFAAQMGIGLIVLDLSLLEPPDLVGLPVVIDGTTRYAQPMMLPTGGEGILLLEELNRAELAVLQPALQLLTARRLHGYELPPGWTCVAAINPADGDYQVARLDPALEARFLRLPVCADRQEWLLWAEKEHVHPAVLALARANDRIFEVAPPRSWTYVSDILRVLRAAERNDGDLVQSLVSGYLPVAWSLAVVQELKRHRDAGDVDLDALIAGLDVRKLGDVVRRLREQGQTDGIEEIVHRLCAFLVGPGPAGTTTVLDDLDGLTADLPGDMRERCREAMVQSPAALTLMGQLGIEPAKLLRHGYAATGVRKMVDTWLRGGKEHRVRMLVRALVCHMQRGGAEVLIELRRSSAGRINLGELIAHVGKQRAAELVQWLAARSIEPIEPKRGSR